MSYLASLPGLLCGLALSAEDVHSRRVPRKWVAVGAMAQLAASLAYAIVFNDLFSLLASVLFALLSALAQAAMAIIRPSALGFGDVTATLVIGLSVGLWGLTVTALWWVIMGLFGVSWIVWWSHCDPQRHGAHAGRVPYVPVIAIAGIIAVAIGPLL
ncbi:prepilin peptidase [Bifidobacterium jacchi]|uniref:Peptidase A24 n=1 Tax=Bifidobacterium jacchi TaxID=2490545 RepID=A0A5N5RIA0_9BIFI|nr:prepilin peptidase [Bifidobacterium jacchi]KAB5606839.1 peptidase A24 [Bifidobacterium jacchi]